MDKVSYLKAAMKHEAHRYKEWALSVFCVVADGLPQSSNSNLTKPSTTMNLGTDDYAYRLYHNAADPQRMYFKNPETNTLEVISDSDRAYPLFRTHDIIDLTAGDLPNLKINCRTLVGTAVLNGMILCIPFGGKIDYINDRLTAGLDDVVASMMSKDPVTEGMVRDPKLIYVDELLVYHETLGMAEGFAQITVPTYTSKALTPNPKVIALRDSLLKQHANELKDPAVVADIMRQIADLDQKELANDPSIGFYMKSDKAWLINRMKALYLYGTEVGFGAATGDAVTILSSIDDGIDLEHMPAMVDATRSASNSRGNLTALGGAKVKYLSRIFQNTRIIMVDCGTRNGAPYVLRKDNVKLLKDRYRVTDKGAAELITPEYLQSNLGQLIYIRTSAKCRADEPSYCAMCFDEGISIRPNGLYALPMDVSSVLMNDAMKAMHGRAATSISFDTAIAFGL